jgi:hypothetical protein
MSSENEPEKEELIENSDVYIHEHQWTAQMVGKDFFYHHDTIHVLYHINPMPREDFTLSDTF